MLHLVNSLLLEPKERRVWSGAFRSLSTIVRPDLLTVSSVAKKVARTLADTHGISSHEMLAGHVFDVSFPEGASLHLRLVEEERSD